MTISSISNLAMQVGMPSGTSSQRSEDDRTLIQAVRAVNASEMLGQENELTFILDNASRRAIVRILNKRTREVVQQIPAEYVLRIAGEMKRG